MNCFQICSKHGLSRHQQTCKIRAPSFLELPGSAVRHAHAFRAFFVEGVCDCLGLVRGWASCRNVNLVAFQGRSVRPEGTKGASVWLPQAGQDFSVWS